MSASNTATGRYLRLPDVLSETGLGKTTIYHLIGEGQFPKPVKVLSRARGLAGGRDRSLEG